MLATAAAVFAAAAAATVNEMQCGDEKCSQCKTAQSWDIGKCYPLGNAPPYHVSQKMSQSGKDVTLTSYTGDSCASAAVQTDTHALDNCTFFTGQIWTVFKAATPPLAAPSAMKCPGSPAPITHCGMKITATANATCADVKEEADARVAGQASKTWHDPHNNGKYTSQSYGGDMSFSRLTGDGKYTDKMIFSLSGSGATCTIEACSESQVFSVSDFGTNYCDLKMLFCGSADGCKPVKHDFTVSGEKTEKMAEASVDLKGCLKV